MAKTKLQFMLLLRKHGNARREVETSALEIERALEEIGMNTPRNLEQSLKYSVGGLHELKDLAEQLGFK